MEEAIPFRILKTVRNSSGILYESVKARLGLLPVHFEDALLLECADLFTSSNLLEGAEWESAY